MIPLNKQAAQPLGPSVPKLIVGCGKRILVVSDQVQPDIFPDSPEEQLLFIKTFWNVVEEFIVVLRAEKPIRQPGSLGDVAPIHIGYRHELGGLA